MNEDRVYQGMARGGPHNGMWLTSKSPRYRVPILQKIDYLSQPMENKKIEKETFRVGFYLWTDIWDGPYRYGGKWEWQGEEK